MNKHRTLTRGFEIYTCRGCGKRTRVGFEDDVDAYNLELCYECWEDAGLENDHSDGHHSEVSNPDCRWC